MIAYLFGRHRFVRYGESEMRLAGHIDCGRGGTEPAGCRLEGRLLRRLREGRSRAYVVTVAHDGVVATMTVTAAGFAFLLDIRNLAAGRELAIAADDASAGESGEAKKSNETHKTLTPIAITASRLEQVLYRTCSASLRRPLTRNYRRCATSLDINSKKNLLIVGAQFSRLDKRSHGDSRT